MTDTGLNLMTPKQLARELGCSERTLERDRLKGGGIPFIRFGALVRYRRQDVEEYLERRRHGSTSEADQRESAA